MKLTQSVEIRMDSMQTTMMQRDSATTPFGFTQKDGRSKPERNNQFIWARIDLGKIKISKT